MNTIMLSSDIRTNVINHAIPLLRVGCYALALSIPAKRALEATCGISCKISSIIFSIFGNDSSHLDKKGNTYLKHVFKNIPGDFINVATLTLMGFSLEHLEATFHSNKITSDVRKIYSIFDNLFGSDKKNSNMISFDTFYQVLDFLKKEIRLNPHKIDWQ